MISGTRERGGFINITQATRIVQFIHTQALILQNSFLWLSLPYICVYENFAHCRTGIPLIHIDETCP